MIFPLVTKWIRFIVSHGGQTQKKGVWTSKVASLHKGYSCHYCTIQLLECVLSDTLSLKKKKKNKYFNSMVLWRKCILSVFYEDYFAASIVHQMLKNERVSRPMRYLINYSVCSFLCDFQLVFIRGAVLYGVTGAAYIEGK